MRITERDVRLLRDLALSHVLSRDQLVQIGYFTSLTRVNTRMRELERAQFIRRLETPFFAQSLYVIGQESSSLLGEHILPVTIRRAQTPRFLQHALCLTNIRIALLTRGCQEWRFEQQVRCTFGHNGKSVEVRPDGLALMPSGPVFIEADLGHVAPSKFREKLKAYNLFATSGEAKRQLRSPRFKVLTVTTGRLRASSLVRQLPPHPAYGFACIPASELGISYAGSWS